MRKRVQVCVNRNGGQVDGRGQYILTTQIIEWIDILNVHY